MAYSEAQQVILNHFFTTTDGNVYFLRNFEPEVAATLLASYSRSQLPLRDKLLETIVDIEIARRNEGMPKEARIRMLRENEESQLYSRLASIIRGAAPRMADFNDFFVQRARKFLGIYADKYGHASIKDMGHGQGFACEDVSIVLTKDIELDPLGDYQEKSTRYLKFDESSVMMPSEFVGTPFEARLHENTRVVMAAYRIATERITEHLYRTTQRKDGISDDAHRAACQARAFDYARYLLPARIRTSLGMVSNARTLDRIVSNMLASPVAEISGRAEEILREGRKVFPTLLLNTHPNEYLRRTDEAARAFVRNLNIRSRPVTQNGIRLLDVTPDAEDKLIASMLYLFTDSDKEWESCYEAVKEMSTEKKEEAVHVFLDQMRQTHNWQDAVTGEVKPREYRHDPTNALNEAMFKFGIVVDYGAYRDVQRMRRCSQQRKPISCGLGYDIPAIYEQAGIRDLLVDACEHTTKLFNEAKTSGRFHPEVLQYIPTLAFRISQTMTTDVWEMFYMIALRTTPQGHFSYRKIFQGMFELAQPHIPIISKHITVDRKDYELGREKEEQTHLDKLAARAN